MRAPAKAQHKQHRPPVLRIMADGTPSDAGLQPRPCRKRLQGPVRNEENVLNSVPGLTQRHFPERPLLGPRPRHFRPHGSNSTVPVLFDRLLVLLRQRLGFALLPNLLPHLLCPDWSPPYQMTVPCADPALERNAKCALPLTKQRLAKGFRKPHRRVAGGVADVSRSAAGLSN